MPSLTVSPRMSTTHSSISSPILIFWSFFLERISTLFPPRGHFFEDVVLGAVLVARTDALLSLACLLRNIDRTLQIGGHGPRFGHGDDGEHQAVVQVGCADVLEVVHTDA